MKYVLDTSDAFGRIKAFLERRGLPIEDFDVAIAAHAVTEGAILVTANRRHMSRVPNLEMETWGSRDEPTAG